MVAMRVWIWLVQIVITLALLGVQSNEVVAKSRDAREGVSVSICRRVIMPALKQPTSTADPLQ